MEYQGTSGDIGRHLRHKLTSRDIKGNQGKSGDIRGQQEILGDIKRHYGTSGDIWEH